MNNEPIHAARQGVSPADIIPLPRIQIKRNRSSRGLKSQLLTATPNRERLERLHMEKSKKLQNKATCIRQRILFTKNKRPKPNRKPKKCSSADLSSSESSSFTVCESGDSPLELSDDSEDEYDIHTFKSKDFVVVRVYCANKSSFRHYIANIVLKERTGVRVCFFKRHSQTWKFEKTLEHAFVENSDVIKKLKRPTMCSSGRFQGMVQFQDDLTDFSSSDRR